MSAWVLWPDRTVGPVEPVPNRSARKVGAGCGKLVANVIYLAVGAYFADAGSKSPAANVTISKPVAFDGHVPAGYFADLNRAAGRGFNRAAVELAGKLVSPQTLADVFYVTQAMADLKP